MACRVAMPFERASMKSPYRQCLQSCDSRRDLRTASRVLFDRTSEVPTAMLRHSGFRKTDRIQDLLANDRTDQQVFVPTMV